MSKSSFVVTEHAVDQYISRWMPNLSHFHAKKEINKLLMTASCHGKTILGDKIFVSGERPDIRMIVKDRNVCVTILPSNVSEAELFHDKIMMSLMEEIKDLDPDPVILEDNKREQDKKDMITQLDLLLKEQADLREQKKIIGNKQHTLSNKINVLQTKIAKI